MNDRARWRNCRAIVTGASGFIGTWVVRELQGRGAHVTCVVRSREGAERLARQGVGDTLLLRDLRDFDQAATDLRSLRPHVVLNCAGYGVIATQSDERMADDINHRLPAVLVRAIRPNEDGWVGARFLHIGSAQEYGAAGGVFSEERECKPTTLYGQSKLAGTRAVLSEAEALGCGARIARLFTVYGPGEPSGRLLPTLIAGAKGLQHIPLTNGQQRRDFAYVEDVARQLVDLVEVPVDVAEIVNVATGTLHTVREFVDAAAAVLEISSTRLEFGAVATRQDEMAHDGVSVERLRARIGRVLPDDMRAGVARTLARVREFESA